MSRAFRFPVWTPRTFNDAAIRWLLDETQALYGMAKLAGVPNPSKFDFARRKPEERAVTFPTFSVRTRDLLFSVPWKSAEHPFAHVYLALEHQSKAAALARLRLLCLCGGLWQDDWAKWTLAHKREDGFRPQLVLPIVFYTGDDSWSGPKAIGELADCPAELQSWLPTMPLAFIDLKRRDDLAQLGPFGQVLSVLQAEHQDAKGFGERIRETMSVLERQPKSQRFLVRRWLWYIYCLMHHQRPVEEHPTWRRFIETSVDRQELREELKIMKQTIAESIFEQGIEQGIEQGERRLLLRQMKTKFGAIPLRLRQRLMGIDDSNVLESLGDILVQAQTLAEIDAAIQGFETKPARGGKQKKT